MRLTKRSSLKEVAGCVSEALAAAGLRAVLSGGGCASIHSRGAYQSADLDFILQRRAAPEQLDGAMADAGFRRRGNQYFHPEARYYVEFPPGPLSIGNDYRIEPVEQRIGRARLLALSPTDSCRDRLAGFFHWNDFQSLEAALAIALRNEIDLHRIRAWSAEERARPRFDMFMAELERRRNRRVRRALRRRS